ncbi:probable ATP-dependent RNA helicase DDX20 [Dermacentor albipictus]|uniref:probable ATP-dependent RNA helicase DDX20 n=1 Tax=Dermacentor albipictus TaxID=60249 RepID=UPI0031FD05BB
MTRRIAHKLETQWRSQDVLQSEDENATFEEFLLSRQLLGGLHKSGFVRPSPIQLRAIPLGLCGFDMVVQAKSGTGKTCVFSVLTLQAVNVSKNVVQVLILAPTREIAVQSCDTICCLGCDMPELRVYAFIGGVPIKEDLQKLTRCHVAVGTLGRLLQLIQQGQLSLEWVRLLVLDEADQLLGEGFQEDLRKLWASLPERRQVVATSATYPPEVARVLEEELLHKPMVVRLGADTPALLGVSQWYCLAEGTDEAAWFSRKLRTLDKLLRQMPFSQCLVFLNSQARAQSLEERLRRTGHRAQLLSGAQAQSERIKALVCLKAYRCRILVSTDLAARGIDAERVTLVIHFDVAYDLETHLHRSGRAGRYGTAGQAVTLVTGSQELQQLRTLCAPLGLDIRPLPGFPSLERGSSNIKLNGDVSTNVADEMSAPVVEITSTKVTSLQGNSFKRTGCGIVMALDENSSEETESDIDTALEENSTKETGSDIVTSLQEDSFRESSSDIAEMSAQNISKVTCAQLIQLISTNELSSQSGSAEAMPPSVNTVLPPADNGSRKLLAPTMQQLIYTVESSPESDSKEACAQVMQSSVKVVKLSPTQGVCQVKKSLLQPMMYSPLKLEEILMGRKVPPRIQPILEWPPDPSIGKELAARIKEEKEAFSKAYGVVFEPGRSLNIAVAERGSKKTCASSSRDEAIPSHDEHKEAEGTKPVGQFVTADDQSNVNEKWELSGVSSPVVDIEKVVSSHEKQELKTEEATHVLHSDISACKKTSEGQQEANVQASVSKDNSRELVDIEKSDSFSLQPQMCSLGLEESKPKERHGAAQANATNDSLKMGADKSSKIAETMENKRRIVYKSKRKPPSLDPELAVRMKGRTLESGQPQPRSLNISKELRKTILKDASKENDNVIHQKQKQPKSTSFAGGSDDGNSSVLHIGCVRSSTPSQQWTLYTHSVRPATVDTVYLPPVTWRHTSAVRLSHLPDSCQPIRTSLCYRCVQKCEAIRATCCREHHSLRTATAASSFPSSLPQLQVRGAAMDWSRNWFMWHQWYIRRMLQANGYH